MAQYTTMTRYQDVVLECQHCYTICRYTEAAVRRNCPACGRSIANWKELTVTVPETVPENTSGPPLSKAKDSMGS